MLTVLSLLCCLAGTASAANCETNAPQTSLRLLNAGCLSHRQSRSPYCIAAMHQFCQDVTYPTQMTTLAVPRETSDGKIGISCVHTHSSGYVSIVPSYCARGYVNIWGYSFCNNYVEHPEPGQVTLANYYSQCFFTYLSETSSCLTAIHNYCVAMFGEMFAGIGQGTITNKIAVHCFRSPRKEDLRWHVLQDIVSTCNLTNLSKQPCFSAASSWCYTGGYSGGIP